MKVGDYVRTKMGVIHKITDLKPFYENDKLIEDRQEVYIDNKHSGYVYWQFIQLIIKSSPNIIDLIEVGDYVNGSKVLSKEIQLIWLFDYKIYDTKYITNEDIKSIVTKEQFEAMKYEVK